MSIQDEVQEIIEKTDTIKEAADVIINGKRSLVVFVVMLGLEHFSAKKRRERRRQLRTEVKPQFQAGPVTGSVVLTKSAKKRLLKSTRELFGDDGWMIGELNLGDFTKEQLIAQAVQEEAQAKGSIRNAQFYRALAEPLQPGQVARDYWKSETAHKIKQGIWKGTEDQRPDLV